MKKIDMPVNYERSKYSNHMNRAVYDFLKETGLKQLEIFRIYENDLSLGEYCFNKKMELVSIHEPVVENIDNILKNLLQGKLAVEPVTRYTPAAGDTYFYIKEKKGLKNSYTVGNAVWENSLHDIAYNLMGNCYRNEQEANNAVSGNAMNTWMLQYENKCMANDAIIKKLNTKSA